MSEVCVTGNLNADLILHPLGDFPAWGTEVVAGLGCWADPWGVMGLFGGEAFSAFVPRHADACQVLRTGPRAPAACPSDVEMRAAMRLWIDAAVEVGGETIF